jgi:hypothetical protein
MIAPWLHKLITTAALACFAAPAGAHYYNESWHCGSGRIWIANPVEGHGAERERKLVIEMPANFERTTVVRFDPATDEVTLNGRACRRARDQE